jgi:hypothetical protein
MSFCENRFPVFADHALSRAGAYKREHDALPLDDFGARHRLKLSDMDAGLLKD